VSLVSGIVSEAAARSNRLFESVASVARRVKQTSAIAAVLPRFRPQCKRFAHFTIFGASGRILRLS